MPRVEHLESFRARQLLGRDAIIGATAHSLEEAIGAERAGADYLGVGPVFESRTKRVSAPRGAEWLSTIVHAVKIPCLAIGGVNVENIETLARTGVHGVAVCEALMSSGDARTIAQAMQAALDRHRSLR
ncbi:MAG: thiamine phosphate synthase [Planctomycetes bacterium]|nr:thiamine phosphate synthase [Planctomycetota bacterium]